MNEKDLKIKYVVLKLKDIRRLPEEAQLILWDIIDNMWRLAKMEKEAKDANSSV